MEASLSASSGNKLIIYVNFKTINCVGSSFDMYTSTFHLDLLSNSGHLQLCCLPQYIALTYG